LKNAEDPESFKKEKVDEFRRTLANPYVAAERGYVDAVIEPADTRPKLISGLRMLETKVENSPPKKHGNIPL
jgi:acetyl-CoA carboxylase carboxyltransferase component